MQFPIYIQKAVDLGLLTAQEGKITACQKDEVETVLGMARLMEKIQPTTTAGQDDTKDQEAIVLCRILTSPTGKARELWTDLRVAVGVGHGQELPHQLWSTREFKDIGHQIDAIYLGQSDASVISPSTVIDSYSKNPTGSVMSFNQTVSDLSQKETMARYGDAESEWDVALDLLRQARARATFKNAQGVADKAVRTETKLEKAIEAQQQELMQCLGMLRGTVGSQGNAVDAVEDLISPKDGQVSLIDQIMNAREMKAPVSTGLTAMDIDMEGGVRVPGQSAGGRLFTLAARCLAKDTPVIMADGSVRPVQEVKVGEHVLGPDGLPRLVTAASSGQEEMFKVTPVKGDSYVVNRSHILSLRLTSDGTGWKKEINGIKYDQGSVVNITVSDYLELSAKKKHLLKGWKPDAVEFHGAPAYEGPLTPYLAGAYLGDGDRHAPRLTLSDNEIIEELRSFCAVSGYKLRETDEPGCTGCAISKGVNDRNLVSAWMRDNDFVGQGKHIPATLKRGTIEQRLEVLAGILDTDGCVSNNCFDITVKEQRFASDIVFVARSLGLAANQKECQKSIKSRDFTGTYYRVTISGDTSKVPTRVPRKQCQARTQKKNVLNTGIRVESVGLGSYYGFTLSGPDHLFLLGDFTVTHNTGVGKTVLGVYAAVNLAVGGLKVGFISAELDKSAIYARIWAAATRAANPNTNWVQVGDIESPGHNREEVSQNIMMAAGVIQGNEGKLLIEDPWGADVVAVINSLRSMKAKNPDLRCAIIDHFHVLARHKGAPQNESGMLEDRAYKLMNAAKELEIDLIVLAQMNRVGMDTVSSQQPPALDQIRGTDALSHVSHAVWIVRKQMEQFDGERKWTGKLEFHHSKTRGRQAYWDNGRIQGVKGFIESSVLSMDYAHSSVAMDQTNPRQNR